VSIDELIDWVVSRLPRLEEEEVPKERQRHVSRMFKILNRAVDQERVAKDWLALANTIAKLLNDQAPLLDAEHLKPRKRRPTEGSKAAVPAFAKSKSKRRRAEPPARPQLQMSPELDRAFAAVAGGKPIVFVTGGAGTGKSTFIRELRARFPEKQSIVLAPTGVAALNAGGQTIHSFCKFPLRPVMPEDIHLLDDREVVEKLDLLVVDEVSMVRADILDGLEHFLRVNRKSQMPFGGVQIVLVGDLFQLPPVVTSSDEELLNSRYESPYFFSARCLKGLAFTPIELQVVYRQSDVNFAAMLRDLRDGENIAGALAEINRHCVGRQLSGNYLTLMPTRKAAAEENARRLAALPGSEKTHEAKIEGTFSTGSDDRLPAPQKLVLKPNAQVMFVRNDPEGRWVNGTLGIIEKSGTGSIDVRLENGESYEVKPVEWQNIKYGWDEKEKKIVDEILGTFTQLPLMPAWAVTIHKAQGLTLAKVLLDLGRGAFAEGQTYVALSRCQALEGLSLARAVHARDIRTSAVARAFHDRIKRRAAVSAL